MADQKISQLADLGASVAVGDYIPIVDATETATKRVTLTNVLAVASDGWMLANETWTYVSASTFTVSGDQTTRYTKGARLKWTQTTVRYGVVVASSYGAPNTTVTIAVNTDYTIANAAISDNYYSYMANPQGYPTWFNFAPARAVSGGTVPTYTDNDTTRFSIVGSECRLSIHWRNVSGGTAGAGANAMTFTLPCTISDNIGNAKNVQISSGNLTNGTTYGVVSIQQITNMSTGRFVRGDTGGVVSGDAQNNGVRVITFQGAYEI